MDTHIVRTRLAAAAGTAATCTVHNALNQRMRLTGINHVPNATSAANATNYASIRPYKAAGTSAPLAAAVTTASVALTTQVPAAVTLTGTGTALDLAAGEVMHADLSHAGSGVAVDIDVEWIFQVIPSA